jgi:hypothetical protein
MSRRKQLQKKFATAQNPIDDSILTAELKRGSFIPYLVPRRIDFADEKESMKFYDQITRRMSTLLEKEKTIKAEMIRLQDELYDLTENNLQWEDDELHESIYSGRPLKSSSELKAELDMKSKMVQKEIGSLELENAFYLRGYGGNTLRNTVITHAYGQYKPVDFREQIRLDQEVDKRLNTLLERNTARQRLMKSYANKRKIPEIQLGFFLTQLEEILEEDSSSDEEESEYM